MEINKLVLETGKPSADGLHKGGSIIYMCKCGQRTVITEGGIVAPIGSLYCLCGERWPEDLKEFSELNYER